MHDYRNMKMKYGGDVNTVMADPEMVLEWLELKEALIGIFFLFLFGAVYFSPIMILISLGFTWVVWPQFRGRFERGFVWHWLHRKLNVPMKGMIDFKKEGYSN